MMQNDTSLLRVERAVGTRVEKEAGKINVFELVDAVDPPRSHRFSFPCCSSLITCFRFGVGFSSLELRDILVAECQWSLS